MRVHHINAGTMCPFGGPLIAAPTARARWGAQAGGAMGVLGALQTPAELVCHCLVVETERGLVLVDTGIGRQDMLDPKARLGRAFVQVARPRLDVEDTAHAQIQRLGLDPRDVRFILPTHLDLDHAGGLGDFPEATVFILESEKEAALHPRGLMEHGRYRAVHFAHSPRWKAVRTDEGQEWFGFSCVRDLPGLPPEILIVPLIGHTRGHAAIAVQTGDKTLLHCGDAYFHHAELSPGARRCPPALDLFQRLAAVDDRERMKNQHRLRDLAHQHGSEVDLFCAHDPVELERLRTLS